MAGADAVAVQLVRDPHERVCESAEWTRARGHGSWLLGVAARDVPQAASLLVVPVEPRLDEQADEAGHGHPRFQVLSQTGCRMSPEEL